MMWRSLRCIVDRPLHAESSSRASSQGNAAGRYCQFRVIACLVLTGQPALPGAPTLSAANITAYK